MAANVETMFYVREKPWHGLGVEVQEALNSADALKMAGLDWEVKQRNIQVCGGAKIENYKANVRSTDGRVLGVVSDRYQIVQNKDAGWGVVNAMSDMISHSAPRRQTGSYRENNWNRIMDGHKMLDRMTELVCAR